MPQTVYCVMQLFCSLVNTVPIGTNLGLVHVFWMLLSGELLVSRGAIIPGLHALGLPADAVRRAWATVGQGTWTSADILDQFAPPVAPSCARSPASVRDA